MRQKSNSIPPRKALVSLGVGSRRSVLAVRCTYMIYYDEAMLSLLSKNNWTSDQRRSLQMKITRNVGMLLLAVWLILTGLIPLLNFSFSGLGAVMAILAIAAGVFIILGR